MQNAIYKCCDRVAIRMDILPETEQVIFQKVGMGGKIRNVSVYVKNLEFTKELDGDGNRVSNLRPLLEHQR